MSQTNVSNESHAASVSRRLDPAYILSAASIVLVIVIALLVVYRLNPPQPTPVSAPVTEFSGDRAFKHLSVIAQRPHPVGSAEHAAVASYIQNELTALGLSPVVQQAPTATNILVRLEGTTDEKAVLLVSHYDSVPSSPGASDDGSAVVSILETLRALKSSQPLRNDVIALFSDAEELGMRGALAFVYQHPWAKDVGVVLNFDARGNSGPVIMFETTRNNSWLVKEFAKVAPHPSANSVAPAVYGLMPNKTDMTIFKEAGFAGLNFAYLLGSRHYHNPLDNLTSIDHRSIQHQGSTALALTRHFGNLDLTTTAQHNEVYFDVLNFAIISYSERLVVPLAVVVSLIFVVLVVLGFKNKHLTGFGLVVGFMAVPLSVIVTVLIMIPLRRLLIAISSQSNLDLVLFVIITICVLLVVNAKLSRVAGISNLITGCYLWSLILLVLTSLFLKGASYLFTWFLLFNLVALGFVLARKQSEILSSKQLMLLLIGALPGIILFVPLVYLTSVALTLRSFVALFAVGGMMVLLLGSLAPHFAVAGAIRKAFHTAPNT